MANIKSAEKRIKQTAKRQLRNRGRPLAVEDGGQAIPRARGREEGREASRRRYSDIDKARKKGAIHKNAAARYKSRLARKAAKSKAASKAQGRGSGTLDIRP